MGKLHYIASTQDLQQHQTCAGCMSHVPGDGLHHATSLHGAPRGPQHEAAGVQEVGRALKLSAKAAAYLFPETAPAEQGLPQRTPLTMVDEVGKEWPMVYVCKRYSVGYAPRSCHEHQYPHRLHSAAAGCFQSFCMVSVPMQNAACGEKEHGLHAV